VVGESRAGRWLVRIIELSSTINYFLVSLPSLVCLLEKIHKWGILCRIPELGPGGPRITEVWALSYSQFPHVPIRHDLSK